MESVTISKYTKHYYIGSERVASALGSIKSLGLLCESFGADAALIQTMNNKVQITEEVISKVYHTFEKDLELTAPYIYGTEYLRCDLTHYQDMYHPYWYHPDHLGSSSYITNLDGEINQHLEYLPFGEALVEEHLSSYNSPFKFNAKEFDAETGNYYYGARYYDPKLSIFISVDPEFAKFPSWSPYNYTLQNPVRFVDPDGRAPLDIIIRGVNGNTITIPTADNNHKTFYIPYSISESRILDLGVSHINTDNFAVGYNFNASVDFAVTWGVSASAGYSVVNFLNDEYGGYNYVFAQAELKGSVGSQGGGSANIEANFFVMYNTRPHLAKPNSFEGRASSFGISADIKKVAGGGVSLFGFKSDDWYGIGVGLNAGVGLEYNFGSLFYGGASSILLNNEKPTRERSWLDRLINSGSEKMKLTQGFTQYLMKTAQDNKNIQE